MKGKISFQHVYKIMSSWVGFEESACLIKQVSVRLMFFFLSCLHSCISSKVTFVLFEHDVQSEGEHSCILHCFADKDMIQTGKTLFSTLGMNMSIFFFLGECNHNQK